MSLPVPVFLAQVTPAGKLVFEDRAAFVRHVRALAGKPVDVVVKRHRAQRSQKANAYYFGVVVKLLAEHCGYEPDEMHEALAMRFLRIEDCQVTGSPRRKRTPDTDTKEFADYVDACIRFAAELGVLVPDPQHVEAA